jgi:hypothetical protein
MVVAHERPQPVEDLVEEILRAQDPDRPFLDLLDDPLQPQRLAPRGLVRELARQARQEPAGAREELPFVAAQRQEPARTAVHDDRRHQVARRQIRPSQVEKGAHHPVVERAAVAPPAVRRQDP